MTDHAPPPISTTLQRYFGFNTFRPFQEQIITSILNGHDCLAILPTGGGKSLCFQIPGLMMEGLVVVISPLISLMEDQVQQLQGRGVVAAMLSSSLSTEEKNLVVKKIISSQLKFIYLSPEQLQTARWQRISQTLNISFVVIDEAHCTSQWGHDFRPAYTLINDWLTTRKKRPRVAAFTATATTQTILAIQSSLQLQNPVLFKQDMLPEHLHLSVLECPDGKHKTVKLLQILKYHREQAGIIYTLTRKATEEMANFINQLGIYGNMSSVCFYHGGMSAVDRASVQRQFLTNKIQLIIATNAFGMGVDKPDIRFVIHYHLPNSLEAYYQEVGRAGRDRQLAHCYVLAQVTDLKINRDLIKDDSAKKQSFSNMIHLIKVQTCIKNQLANYFSLRLTRNNCRNCSRCTPHSVTNHQDHQIYCKLLKLRSQLAVKYQREPSQILTSYQAALLSILQPVTTNHASRLPSFGTGWIRESWPLLQNGKLYQLNKEFLP